MLEALNLAAAAAGNGNTGSNNGNGNGKRLVLRPIFSASGPRGITGPIEGGCELPEML